MVTITSIKFVHSPILIILTVVVPTGAVVEYPATKIALSTLVSNADIKPSTFE